MYSTGIVGHIDGEFEQRGFSILSEPYEFAVRLTDGRTMLHVKPHERMKMDVTFRSREMRGQKLFALLHIWQYGATQENAELRVGTVYRYSTTSSRHNERRHLFPLAYDADADLFTLRFGERDDYFDLPDPGLFVCTFFLMQEHLAPINRHRAFKDVIDAKREPVQSDLFFMASAVDLHQHVCFRSHQ